MEIFGMSDDDTPQRKGGRARSDSLSPERRRDIAREAATRRWAGDVLTATHVGILDIGGAQIPCAVLEDGSRVLTQEGFLAALGRSTKPKGRSQQVADGLPPFLSTTSLKTLISQEIIDTTVPIPFRTASGVRALGYKADLLPQVCNLFLRARDLGLLTDQQQGIADKCDALVRALAQVGIIALVDEQTGYEKARARNELQKILAAYIAPELLPWAKRFPDSYYEHLHRIRGWKYALGSNARNAYIGNLTNALIYEQLPNGVLEELKARNPRDPETKRRRHTHHEFLTPDIGHPHLERQIVAVTTLLSVSDNWSEFTRLFSKKFPPGPGDLFALVPPEK
jgi:hypothetical protein